MMLLVATRTVLERKVGKMVIKRRFPSSFAFNWPSTILCRLSAIFAEARINVGKTI